MAQPLSFGAELDDEQFEAARKITQRAIEMGMTEEQARVAVAVAFQESRLRPNAPRGSSGEFGIMQVMPRTGKEIGFSVDDLRDPDKNIEAGLTYLKQQMDRYPSNPRLAVIAYNAGPDAKFFSGGPLPETTANYVKNVESFGAFAAPEAVEQPIGEQIMEKAETAATDLATRAMEDQSMQSAAAGAGAGFALGKALPDEGLPKESTVGLERGVDRRRMMLQQLEKEFSALPEAARTAPAPMGGPTPSQVDIERAPPAQTGLERQIQGAVDPESGQTGRARQTGYNELTAQRAAQQRQQAAVEAALRQRGTIAGPSPFSTTPVASTPSGLLVPPQVAAEAAAPAAQAQQAAGLQNQMNTARRNLAVAEGVLSEAQRRQPGMVARAGAAFQSPLAKTIPGALTGLEAAEAGRRYEEGDIPGAALAGGASLGGALMTAPTMRGRLGIAQKTAGALLQYGGGLGLLLYDIMRNRDIQETPPISATR